jgi:mono/diheme cytochrome c family protein
MTGLNQKSSPCLIRILAVCTVFALLAFAGGRLAAQEKKAPWIAPAEAKAVKNPVPATPENLKAAEQIFKDKCVLCHGETGKGDGPAAGMGDVPPANFTDAKLIGAETDGSLFWKMSEGRIPMPSFKKQLSDTERWEMVNYIRKLNKDAAKH